MEDRLPNRVLTARRADRIIHGMQAFLVVLIMLLMFGILTLTALAYQIGYRHGQASKVKGQTSWQKTPESR